MGASLSPELRATVKVANTGHGLELVQWEAREPELRATVKVANTDVPASEPRKPALLPELRATVKVANTLRRVPDGCPEPGPELRATVKVANTADLLREPGARVALAGITRHREGGEHVRGFRAHSCDDAPPELRATVKVANTAW